MAPTLPGERIAILDILRGVSLWGVLASNMIGFCFRGTGGTHLIPWSDPVNRTVTILHGMLLNGKFITIIAVLFGIGFAIQMERAVTCVHGFLARYFRRLVVLSLFGLINGIFFYDGDILFTYATVGLVLLLFRNRSQKTILWWAIGLQVFIFLFSLLLAFSNGKHLPANHVAELERLYCHGTWADIQQERIHRFIQEHYHGIFALVVLVLPRFLFGLWLWRTGFLQKVESKKTFLKSLCFWGICIGIILGGLNSYYDMGELGPWNLWGIPVLAAGFAAGIILFGLSGRLRWLQNSFAAVGRTSVSNYLFQTSLFPLVFLSYGFGLFGKIEPAIVLVLTVLIYAVEILASTWWMSRFRFGPLEWIWRSITYKRWQVLRAPLN